jgi:hypothetical protein
MIKKEKIVSVSFNSNFCEFIHWRQSQEYRTFWVTQYLPMLELEIFVGKDSLMPESGIL